MGALGYGLVATRCSEPSLACCRALAVLCGDLCPKLVHLFCHFCRSTSPGLSAACVWGGSPGPVCSSDRVTSFGRPGCPYACAPFEPGKRNMLLQTPSSLIAIASHRQPRPGRNRHPCPCCRHRSLTPVTPVPEYS